MCVFLDDSFSSLHQVQIFSPGLSAPCETMRNKRHMESTDICRGIVVPSVIADLHMSVQAALPFSSCYTAGESLGSVCYFLHYMLGSLCISMSVSILIIKIRESPALDLNLLSKL